MKKLMSDLDHGKNRMTGESLKKAFCMLFAMLVTVCLLPCSAPAFAGDTDDMHIQVLMTSDIHGAIIDSDYSLDGPESMAGSGLSRIATLIREYRETNPNTLLIDNGDITQGTALAYYFAFKRGEVMNPAIKALRVLEYDAWVPGNHEFNFGLDVLNRRIRELTAPAVQGESPVPVLAANYLVRGAEGFIPWKQDYIVKEFDGVRVGVIGLGNLYIPLFEKPENWAEIDFRTFLDTWEYYASILKEQEGCDIVVVCCHSGLGTTAGKLVEAADLGSSMNGKGLYYEESYENQIAALIENSTGIDLVLGGHTHETGIRFATNREGREIPVIHCGCYGQNLGVADIVWNRKNGLVSISCDTVNAEETEPDTDFMAALMEYENILWNEYMHEEIGIASGDFMAPGNMLEANAFLDLVNQAQLKVTGAQMSISAPVTSDSKVLIPAGKITLGQMFQLYTFENWLYNINMTGLEIKEWLEHAAEEYSVNEDGSVKGGGKYCDTLYGEGVSYEIWLGNAAGDRVRNLTWQDKPLDMEENYQVVINNYRFSGGGHYIEKVPSMKPNDTSRVNFSTQYDMEHGYDDGQIRNLLAEYIREKGVIDPVVTSEFHVYAGASPEN